MKAGRVLPRWQQNLLRVCLGLVMISVFSALALAPFVLQRNLETADTTAMRNELFELHQGTDALTRAISGWRATRDAGTAETERAGLELDERVQLLAHRLGVVLAYPGALSVLPENGATLRRMRELLTAATLPQPEASPQDARAARDRVAILDQGELVELDRYIVNAFRRLGQITANERWRLTQLGLFAQRFASFLLFVGVLTLAVLWLQQRWLRRAEMSLQSVMGDLGEAQRIAHIGNVRRDYRKDRVTWSPQFARIYGLDPDGHMTGAEFEALLLPADAESVLSSERDALARSAETRAPVRRDMTFRALRSDGEVIELEVQSELLADAEGQPVSMVSTIRDITQEARARRALRESERSLAAAQRIARLGSFRHNYKTGKTHWSSELYVVLDHPREHGPTALMRIVHPDDHERVRQMFSDLLADGPPQGQQQVGFDCRVLTAEGEERCIRGTAEMAYDAAGKPDMLTGSLQDVTTEIEQERALRDALAEAERANTAKSEFLAVMSHELRTPMNGVLGMLHAMDNWELDESQRHHIQIARTSADALLVILNDVLDMSKIEAGRMELDQRPFALRPLVDSVIDLYAETARTKDIGLQATIDPSLPEWVSGDPLRIRQILANIVSNAVKFTQVGGVELALLPVPILNAPEGMAALRFCVSDSGIGIPLEMQDYVFGRFNQLDTSYTRRFGGTGLGLAISRSLAELMGGRMNFASKPGKGSSFWFDLVLPLADPVAAPPAPQPDPELRSMLILVAEDNATNQIVARSMLERLGQQVEFVGDGAAAIDAVSRTDYDMVLMDISMPVMDGIEATRRIRRLGGRHAAMPILALTAHAGQSEHRACLEAGCNEVLTKPMDRGVLRAALHRWSVWQMPDADPAPDPKAAADGDSLAARLSDLGDQIGAEALPDLIKASLGDLSHHGGLIATAASGETVAQDMLRRACHSVVGIAATFGASRLTLMARRAEAELKQPDARLTEPEPLLSALHQLEAALCEALEALRHKDPAPRVGAQEES